MPHIHFHHPNNHRRNGGGGQQSIPRGHVAVTVGPEHQRFVIQLAYVNHPLFKNLLKEAEEEYGFGYQEGPIDIPCHVDDFCRVMGLVGKETASYQHHHHHHHDLGLSNNYNNHQHHHHHQFLCFKA